MRLLAAGRPVLAQAWDSPAADALVDRAVARRGPRSTRRCKAWTGDGAGTLAVPRRTGQLDGAAAPGGEARRAGDHSSGGKRRASPSSASSVAATRCCCPATSASTTIATASSPTTSATACGWAMATTCATCRIRSLPAGARATPLPSPIHCRSRCRADGSRRTSCCCDRAIPRIPGWSGACTSIARPATSCAWPSPSRAPRFSIARIERLSLVLENLLVDGRYWLPYRQELEVVRGSTWFDFPVEGIVRARWLVTDHAAYADTDHHCRRRYPRTVTCIVANAVECASCSLPRTSGRSYQWDDADHGGDRSHRAGTDRGGGAVRCASRRRGLVQQRVLTRASARVDRRTWHFRFRPRQPGRGPRPWHRMGASGSAALWRVGARVAYGFSDEQVKGGLELSWLVADPARHRVRRARRIATPATWRKSLVCATRSPHRSSVMTTPIRTTCTPPACDCDLEPVGPVSWDHAPRRRATGQPERARDAMERHLWPTIPASALDAIRLDVDATRQRDAIGTSGNTLGWRLNGRLEGYSIHATGRPMAHRGARGGDR